MLAASHSSSSMVAPSCSRGLLFGGLLDGLDLPTHLHLAASQRGQVARRGVGIVNRTGKHVGASPCSSCGRQPRPPRPQRGFGGHFHTPWGRWKKRITDRKADFPRELALGGVRGAPRARLSPARDGHQRGRQRHHLVGRVPAPRLRLHEWWANLQLLRSIGLPPLDRGRISSTTGRIGWGLQPGQDGSVQRAPCLPHAHVRVLSTWPAADPAVGLLGIHPRRLAGACVRWR